MIAFIIRTLIFIALLLGIWFDYKICTLILFTLIFIRAEVADWLIMKWVNTFKENLCNTKP